MTSTAIDLQNAVLTLPAAAGPVEILKGIDLSVARGEVLSVVGPSGSGKSSMMMLIAGLERATAGRVTVDGRDLTGLGEDALARFRRDRIGVVFQDFHLIPTMTALENVAVPLEFAGRADAFKRAEESLEQVGLAHRLTHYPGQLSGGEQQRVALARAFAPAPAILLADDGETGRQVIDLLFDLQEHHDTTLMLITHDPALAERCGRQVRLKDGRIDAGGAAAAAE